MGRGDREGGKVGENFLGSISGHWEKVPQRMGQPGESGGGEEGRRVNFNRCGLGGGLKRPKIDSGRWLYNSERAKTTEL